LYLFSSIIYKIILACSEEKRLQINIIIRIFLLLDRTDQAPTGMNKLEKIIDMKIL